MFLVNSRLGQFSAASSGSRREAGHLTEAPLIPKLRGHFAEFLNEGSLDRLGMLYLPTCVGFGTGAFPLPRGFSWRHGLGDWPELNPAGIAPRVIAPLRIYLQQLATCLPQDDHRLGSLSLPRPLIGHNDYDVVQEYQPVGHRLRLSASA